MYLDIHVQCLLFLSDFKQSGIRQQISVHSHTRNFMEICPVGVTLIHADGKTNMLKFVACKRAS